MPATSASFSHQPFARVFPWVGLVAGIFFLTYVNRAVFGPLLPFLEEEFGKNHAESTRLMLFMALGYACSMPLSGLSVSLWPPRALVTGAGILSGCCMLGIALAINWTLLTCLCVLLGIGAGQYFNAGMCTMRSMVRPVDWSKAIAMHQLGPNLSFVAAPCLAWGAALLGAWRPVVAGMGLTTIAVSLLFFAKGRGGREPAPRLSFRGIGSLLRSPGFWAFTWLIGMGISGEFAPYSVLQLYLVDELLWNEENAQLLLAASRTTGCLALVCGGWLTASLGVRKMLLGCFLGYAGGLFCMAMPREGLLLAGMFLQPLFSACAMPPIFMLAAQGFPADQQAMVMALGLPLASLLGCGLMPAAFGLWGEYASFQGGFAMLGLLVLASLPPALWMTKNK